MFSTGLIKTILSQYSLPLSGVHGPCHWARVLENGLRLAKLTGADLEVVGLFAILHDSQRATEGNDRRHGLRAAVYARKLRGSHIDLDHHRFTLLSEACALHTEGETEADITIQTCWDADRLDLGRVWITPDPILLCTEAARNPELISWATERAKGGFRPARMDEWV